MASPSAKVRALETLLAKIRFANACLTNYDMWSDRGRSFATAQEIANMDAEAAAATRDLEATKPALEALVASTRAEAPDELIAWVDAHDDYLAAFVAEHDAKGEDVGFAIEARAQWAEVRTGIRAFVETTGGISEEDPRNASRFRALFGLDPKTLEPAVFEG